MSQFINYRLKDGFGQVSNNIMRDPEVSLQEKAVYSYLCTYSDASTNQTYVGIAKMANECGVSQSTIKRILDGLESKKIIMRVSRGNGLTTFTNLLK
jgi:DNA-binding MarR family transcriptional regulator